jgi:hypothetical protein
MLSLFSADIIDFLSIFLPFGFPSSWKILEKMSILVLQAPIPIAKMTGTRAPCFKQLLSEKYPYAQMSHTFVLNVCLSNAAD